MYVTATEYGVSTTSGHGIEGVLLNVYRHVKDPTTGRNVLEFAVQGMPFPDNDTADLYALERGWIKARPARRPA